MEVVRLLRVHVFVATVTTHSSQPFETPCSTWCNDDMDRMLYRVAFFTPQIKKAEQLTTNLVIQYWPVVQELAGMPEPVA